MSYNVKFIQESIYNKPDFKAHKKKIPLSMATHRVTVKVRGWRVDHNKYNIVPKTPWFTAVIRQVPKNLKEMGFDELTKLFNKNVISPFVPIIDWNEMTFSRDGRVWFKRNKADLI